jgi:hypothetical protein
MRVRKIVAMSALTLCVCAAAADFAGITAASARTPLAEVAAVFRAQRSDRDLADQASADQRSPGREIGASMTFPADPRQAVRAGGPADIAGYLGTPTQSRTEGIETRFGVPNSDNDLADTATGTAVGLVAGILIGGLVGVIFGTATGVVLILCSGAGVAAIPAAAQAFGSGAAADIVAGGLVGLTVGAIIGLLGVAAPAAVAGAVGYFARYGGRR